MQVMAQAGDAQYDRFQRASHGGIFNANPYCAATGNAALTIVATGERHITADRMAERLRHGLREIVKVACSLVCIRPRTSIRVWSLHTERDASRSGDSSIRVH
jgi:acetylornithine/succinyldiaminopimelate/putrescine aminotransferase